MNLTELAERLTVDTIRWAPTGLYSTFLGWGSRRRIPRPLRAPLLGAFARYVDARVDEAGAPLGEYPSLGAFFARSLRPGARPVAAGPVVAPSDGVVAAAGPIERGSLVQAKGRSYSLAELLTVPSLAASLDGGQQITTYLSPRDYHRVHSPVAGQVVAYHYVPGRRWPVSPRFSRRVDRLLAVNERVVIELATAWGPCVVVMVAAAGVGNVWLRHAAPGGPGGDDGGADTRAWRDDGEPRHVTLDPVAVEAGDELGAFLLGSTVVFVVPPGAPPLAAPAPGQPVLCGQALTSDVSRRQA